MVARKADGPADALPASSAILLFQDVAVVPVLFVLGALGPTNHFSVYQWGRCPGSGGRTKLRDQPRAPPKMVERSVGWKPQQISPLARANRQ